MGNLVSHILLIFGGCFFAISCSLYSNTYVLKKGETLEHVAKRHHTTVAEILKNRHYISEKGEHVFIPVMTRDIFLATNKTHYFKPQKTMIWPVLGLVSSNFGKRWGRKHEGIDISAPEGTPVRSVQTGVVVYSDNTVPGYGNLIVVVHPGGLSTVYAHNKVNLVSEGDRVRRGEVIAQVGRSGKSTGYHLHFEIRKSGDALNPLTYLKRTHYLTSR